MLSKYDSLVDVKNEITEYVNLLYQFKELPFKNDVICIAKHIIFLKKISEYGGNRHYKNSMIYDSLSIMHSLTQNSVRNFYQIYRSFIENFIRSVLDLDDNDNTGVRNLFRLINSKFASSSNSSAIINYINSEYTKCCNFVHSNIKANANVYTYYCDIVKNDEMNDICLKSLISYVLNFFEKITLFIIYEFPNIIDTMFNRKKQELRYLIGHATYAIFEKSLTNYLS